jgi:hypothetical protein
MLSQGKLAHQGTSLPYSKYLLIFPLATLLAQFQIESPQHPCKDHPHLSVGQVPADAVPRADREWLKHLPVVREERRGRVVGRL